VADETFQIPPPVPKSPTCWRPQNGGNQEAWHAIPPSKPVPLPYRRIYAVLATAAEGIAWGVPLSVPVTRESSQGRAPDYTVACTGPSYSRFREQLGRQARARAPCSYPVMKGDTLWSFIRHSKRLVGEDRLRQSRRQQVGQGPWRRSSGTVRVPVASKTTRPPRSIARSVQTSHAASVERFRREWRNAQERTLHPV